MIPRLNCLASVVELLLLLALVVFSEFDFLCDESRVSETALSQGACVFCCGRVDVSCVFAHNLFFLKKRES